MEDTTGNFNIKGNDSYNSLLIALNDSKGGISQYMA